MAHHEAFRALSPVEWSAIDQSGLPALLSETFASAQTLIDSVPVPTAVTQAQRVGNRARSKTDPPLPPAVVMNRAFAAAASPSLAGDPAAAAALLKEWREIKINPRDNTRAINVYKMAARDGKGAWFARRSVHEGVAFDTFRAAVRHEVSQALALKEQRGPGAGNVRGIGAERRVERTVVPGSGRIEVYQLSAQFPAPRRRGDFVAAVLAADGGDDEKTQSARERSKRTVPRQFMTVSRPCVHPTCPQRSGYIRGQYESVEVIREIPVDKPLRRTRSSIDISREEAAAPFRDADREALAREAILRSAQKAAETAADGRAGDERDLHAFSVAYDARSEIGAGTGDDDPDRTEMAIEWLMVTRSDPGGSVPRFLVEKGTPSGIVSDAGRFLDWLASKDPQDFSAADDESDLDDTKAAPNGTTTAAEKTLDHPKNERRAALTPTAPTANLLPSPAARAPEAAPSGFYGMIAGALEAAGSVVALRVWPGSGRTTDSELDTLPESDDSDDDASSIHSFTSAPEAAPPGREDLTRAKSASVQKDDNAKAEISSTRSDQWSDESKAASAAASATPSTQHERELKKLQDRRQQVEEKLARTQERAAAKKTEDGDRDARALQKLKEKHEREMAKQEEKYQKELKRLDQKKQQDEKKAEERRRKQVEREEKANLALELERVKAERDVALKQIDVLKDQVGALQTQNTMLVAKLGKNGLLNEADFRNGTQAEKIRALQ